MPLKLQRGVGCTPYTPYLEFKSLVVTAVKDVSSPRYSTFLSLITVTETEGSALPGLKGHKLCPFDYLLPYLMNLVRYYYNLGYKRPVGMPSYASGLFAIFCMLLRDYVGASNDFSYGFRLYVFVILIFLPRQSAKAMRSLRIQCLDCKVN